jgi:rod shape determining protein RodA
MGATAGGATRWIQLGPVQIQPSEIFKVIAIIFWSSYIADKISELKLKHFAFIALSFALPLYLVLKQPDLGTALVLIFMMIATLLWSKLNKKQLAVFIGLLLAITIVFSLSVKNYSVFGRLLKGYQRDRIEVFLNPSKDPLGRGYNVKQAIIAVGSGGLYGQGLGQGTQSQLQFLPKAQTDFIFAGFAEAFGFVGSLALVIAFSFMIIRIIRVANLAKDGFGLLIAVSAAAMFFFQVVENIGMNIGMLPVTGIPLPFLSYGGSSMVAGLIVLGIVQSVIIRHKKIIF